MRGVGEHIGNPRRFQSIAFLMHQNRCVTCQGCRAAGNVNNTLWRARIRQRFDQLNCAVARRINQQFIELTECGIGFWRYLKQVGNVKFTAISQTIADSIFLSA